jgi:hypothetical protein
MNGVSQMPFHPLYLDIRPVSALIRRVWFDHAAPQTKFSRRITNVQTQGRAGATRLVPESGARDRR